MAASKSAAPAGTYRGPSVGLVLFGPGSVERWHQIPELQRARAILATTPSVSRSPLYPRLTALLAPVLAATFKNSRQHAPVSVTEDLAAHILESGADTVISLGGGSVIDAAKGAIDLLAGKGGGYRTHVALPTTLSAAEFAASYGVTEDETRRKRRGSDPRLLPCAVILDAQLTAHTPDWLWMGSGLRALDHSVETVYAPDRNPVADAGALEAIRLLFRYLPASVPAGERLDERQQCQLAAWLSFYANASVTMGQSHRLGRLIGPLYSIPHGFTSAVLLPHVMDAHRASADSRQALIGEAARQGLGRTDAASGEDAADLVRELVRRVGLPSRLRDAGVPREDLSELAGDSAEDLHVLEAAW